MRYCNFCGQPVDNQTSFCPRCGAQLANGVVYNPQPSAPKNTSSGAVTVCLVFGIVCFCLSFIPIINNIGFFLGLFSLILSFILLFKKGTSKAALIIAILMSVMGMLLTYKNQERIVKTIDEEIIKPLNDTSKELDNYSGKNTKEILKNNVNVEFGTYQISKGSYGLINSKLPVTVKNISKESKSFMIYIEAVDAAGDRINTDIVVVNSLKPGQSQTLNAFAYVSSDDYSKMKNAKFNVYEVSMI